VLEEHPGEVHLSVRVQPRAARNRLVLHADGVPRVAITAPPVDGEANAGLLRYLAEALDCPRRRIRLLRGEKSREKVVAIAGMSAAELRVRLESCAGRET
jgi:uncharacterized protein (TIGR00251 family)